MDDITKIPVNNDIYNLYGDRWYTAYDDPVALLRAESRFKTPWVLKRIEAMKGKSVLDVGCGGGFLSNALSLHGLDVTAVDSSEESLRVAQNHDVTKKVKYKVANAYRLPFADASFDVVTAMDFLEHVEQPDLVIKECSRVLKPGGIFIFHTFNRNFFSWLVVIKFIEWLVKNTPKNMHVLRLFIKPRELKSYCEKVDLEVNEMTGIKLVISSVTLKSLMTGVVPEGLRFEAMRFLFLSYMGVARKLR